MIEKLRLKNFTAFDDIEIDFSSKINVIIGENSTGKTHLLKAAYALSTPEKPSGENNPAEFLTKKLIGVFKPDGNKLRELHHKGTSEKSLIEIKTHEVNGVENKVDLTFSSNSKILTVSVASHYEGSDAVPVFIPAKEVLSFLKGYISIDSDQNTINSLFDETYIDIFNHLIKPSEPDETERLTDPRFGSIFTEMVNAIGGKYDFTGDRFCFKKGNIVERSVKKQHKYWVKKETIFKPIKDSDLSNSMTAEGFRKVGVLQQLLLNKTINPGVSGTLFWDEPEANMNPKLMKLLVQILLELSRNGQQIILATHDYVLLKWFDLLLKKGKDDHVRFHSLYRDDTSEEIKMDSTDDYREIGKNPIVEAFNNLTIAHAKLRLKGGASE